MNEIRSRSGNIFVALDWRHRGWRLLKGPISVEHLDYCNWEGRGHGLAEN